MSKMGKEHTHTFWLITSLILNGFSIRKMFWKAETESFPTIPSNPMYVEACRRCHVEDGKRTYRHTFIIPFLIWYHLNVILCMSKHVKDVKDRSNTPKGCNAMYVENVEDGKRTYTHILAHNFLNT